MKNNELISKLRQKIPTLADRRLEEAIAEKGTLKSLAAGTVIMDYGEYIRQIPIVLTGLIKVTTRGEEDSDLLLYYLSEGSTCPTAFTCCMVNKKSDIKAVVEEDAELISLPVRYVDEWIREFPTWKNFVMFSYNVRFNELLSTIDDIAFSKVDERLLKYLAKKQKLTGKTAFSLTHKEISDDLNTSREAISRLLKKMEKMGKIQLGRNRIEILNLEA